MNEPLPERRTGYRPEIYTFEQRNQQGLAFNPVNGELWASEQGPNGGDEINVITAGKNYGWPIVSYGRQYAGPNQSEIPYKAVLCTMEAPIDRVVLNGVSNHPLPPLASIVGNPSRSHQLSLT